jgi:hypothetical protein
MDFSGKHARRLVSAGTLGLSLCILAAVAPAPAGAATSGLANAPTRAAKVRAIQLFSVTPASLPAVGGTVRIQALVAGARKCRFTGAAAFKKLPTTMNCGGKVASVKVRLPRNRGAAARRYTFHLRTGGASSSASVIVRGHAKGGSAKSAPLIVTQLPSSQAPAANGVVTFVAAASGNPIPSSQWQVSADNGSVWTNVAANADVGGSSSASYSFLATASENGWEYRVVFSNSQGQVASAADTLTVTGAPTAPTGAPTPATSTNWSGYAARSSNAATPFSAVSGSWTVPTLTCSPTGVTYLSHWVGIDGLGGSTVEQDGIEAICNSGVASYYAWYELWGDPSPLPSVNGGMEVPASSATYPVHPGDAITASTSFSSPNWLFTVADTTGGWVYSSSVPEFAPAPLQSTVEWIVELPDVCPSMNTATCTQAPALADFGTADFTGASATVGGVLSPISALNPMALALVLTPGTPALASPGPLNSTGNGFTDTWNASS